MSNSEEKSTELQILAAAEKLFTERGFSGTSVIEIAHRVGCNQALIHYYYRTKERLFEAVFERKITLFFEELLRPVDASMSFEAQLAHRISLNYDMLAEHPRLPFLLINELSTNPTRLKFLKERAEATSRPFLTRLAQDLEHEVAAGRIRPMYPFDLLLTVLSMNLTLFLAGPILSELMAGGKAAYGELLSRRKAEHIRVILAALRPDPSGTQA